MKAIPILVCTLLLALFCNPNARGAMPVATNDESGFLLIFDGKTFKGWEGDTNYWRVENGSLVGEITPEKLLKRNSFVIWRGGKTKDFELKLEYRISAKGNSGINYRSAHVPETNAPWAMRGYQADIDGANRYTGQNYEERGRTFLAMRGQMTRLEQDKTPQIVGSLGNTNELLSIIKADDWNEFHIIVQGDTMTHIINGHVMCVVMDEDAKNRVMEGLLGVQVHTGPPMKVEYRNIRYKNLSGL